MRPTKTFRIILLLILLSTVSSLSAKNYKVSSPNGKITTEIDVTNIVSYSVNLNGDEIIASSTISLQLNNGIVLGNNDKVKKIYRNSVSETLTPVVPRKYSKVENTYNEIELKFKNDYSLIFRVYDDGIAYRWRTNFTDSITIVSEMASFNFKEDHALWFPEEKSVFSHQEREYKHINLSEVIPSTFCSTGTLIDLGDGSKVFISESDLVDYPGMFLRGNKENPFGLSGKFAGYPLETEQLNDRSVKVTKHAPWLAKTKGKRDFPWRVMIITENDAQLVKSEMIWILASPSRIKDPTWIKPGKVAWDWWNDWNIYGVDFKAGVNTETYKYYIDFASDHHIEYVILDEGWYHLEDLLKIKNEVDLPELLTYAEGKGVGIILWVTWKALYDQLDLALNKFEAWGVKGIKVDFMQRDDQWMVNYYSLIAEEAAKHHLLVDFHGAYKPAGLHRTFPNVLTFEGVLGQEHSKWSERANPEHNLTLPFIRMVAGPMDYTPGAMINANQKNFNAVWSAPMSQGTRCHQLAMYIVYESPLQMLCDNPSNYIKEPHSMEFLSAVPVIWDDTKVLEAKVSDYILIARKSRENWFLGAMTDWEEREMIIHFDFLEKGKYKLKIWQDGINADRHASDYVTIIMEIDNKTILPVHLAQGGGWVGIISPVNDSD